MPGHTMRQKQKQLVVTFHTTSAAMELEKRCQEKGIPGRLFPVPRSLTADCGIAWRCDEQTEQMLRELIETYAIEVSGICTLML